MLVSYLGVRRLCAKACGHTLIPTPLLISSAAPIVSTSITSPTGPFIVGQSYSLTCTANVTGGVTLSNTTTISWIHPNGSVTSGTGSSLNLSLNPLRVSDAGQYTCNVSVSSPFLNRALNSIGTLTISVQGKRWKCAIPCGRSHFMSYKFNSCVQSNGQTCSDSKTFYKSLEMEMEPIKFTNCLIEIDIIYSPRNLRICAISRLRCAFSGSRDCVTHVRNLEIV